MIFEKLSGDIISDSSIWPLNIVVPEIFITIVKPLLSEFQSQSGGTSVLYKEIIFIHSARVSFTCFPYSVERNVHEHILFEKNRDIFHSKLYIFTLFCIGYIVEPLEWYTV